MGRPFPNSTINGALARSSKICQKSISIQENLGTVDQKEISISHFETQVSQPEPLLPYPSVVLLENDALVWTKSGPAQARLEANLQVSSSSLSSWFQL